MRGIIRKTGKKGTNMTEDRDKYRKQALYQVDNLAKPPGSLGTLEKQAKQVLLAWGQFHKELRPKHLIFAADNGVVHSGVVAQLADITYMQSRHMVEGTSAVTCFCRSQQIPYAVIDIGIDSEDAVGINRKIARGTRDFSKEPAMSEAQLQQALAAGREQVQQAKAEGINLLSFGEMGIGNTTTSAAVLTALSPKKMTWLSGFGSARGNYKLLFHKRRVIAEAMERYEGQLSSPQAALRCVGGFDLAALCGAMLACADERIPFYIDGFITATALACAVAMDSRVRDYALPSHISREPGMAQALRLCGIDEYDVPLTAGLSLGEGTGAVLGVILLKTMMYAVWHMATLDGINQEAQERYDKRQGDAHHG